MKSSINIKEMSSFKFLFPFALLFASGGIYAQSPVGIPGVYTGTWLNWVRTWLPTAPEQTPGNLLLRPLTDVKQTTEYFDGFGRTIQKVAKNASPLGNDMVTASIYDLASGNEFYRYLPFTANAATGGDVTNDGNFKTDRFQEQVAFYNTYLNGQPNETNVGTGGSNWAYSQMTYESSPLDREMYKYSPGANWVGSQSAAARHNTQQAFLTNTATDLVQIWTIPGWNVANPETNIIPTNAGTYSAETLYKTIGTDEEGNQTVLFKDIYGQTILKKVQLQQTTAPAVLDNGSGSGYTGWISTYYVYDDHGNLRFVITPDLVSQMAAANSWTISQAQADELCYRYEYDQLNRLIVKKTPGTPTGSLGEVWMVYDERNRLVMQQDGNLRNNNKQWKYIQYDNLNRPIATGLITDLNNYNKLSYHVSNAATSGNTTAGVSAWPVLSSYTVEILTQTLYDNYSNIPTTLSPSLDVSTNGTGNAAFTTSYNTSPTYAQPITQSAMTQGMVTGTNAEVLGSSDQQYISVANFYDEKGRMIQMEMYNYTKGKDLTTTQYCWDGKVLNTLICQNYSSSSNPQTHWMATARTYDPTGRLLTVTKTINSTINGVALTAPSTNPATIVTYTYDELGRVKNKELGNNLENLAYVYNVRGWLLGINQGFISGSSNSNYFGLELGYDKPASVASGNSYLHPIFNGNIGGTTWKTKGDGINRKYDFTYDPSNRLLSAAYLQNTSGSTWDNSYLDFSVSGLGYDANGNMTGMNQNGFVQGGKQPIDELRYNYLTGQGNSNRLQYVNDAVNVTNSTLGDFHFPFSTKTSSSNDYRYDDDANTISDTNRSITGISYYGAVNLPNTITVNASAVTGTIQYFYDGVGNKLEKLATQNNVTINGVSTNIVATTKYVDGFVYKSLNYSNSAFASLNYTDVLQFVGDEMGRLRFKPAVGNVVASIVHDYLIRDNLGNVRVGITDELQQDIYPAATGETTQVTVNGTTNDAQNYEAQYYSFNSSDFIPSANLPAWFSSMSGSNYENQNNNGNPANNDPYSQVTTTSARVLQLCGNTANNPSGDNFGSGITLKVMAGDVINIYGLSFWNNTGTLPTGGYPVTAVIGSLLGAFGSSAAVASTASHSVLGGSAFNSSSTGPTATLLSPMMPTSSSQSGYQAPYAGVNYIIFDDQFRPQGATVGFDPVSTTTDNIKNHSLTVPIPKNGYIFVYVSNQSNINVYFDNLQVVQTRGAMLEETHYYPIGLAMAGISDRAWNKGPNYFHFQGKEMQDQEWYNGSGLEEYDFGARYYDPQLGRWNTQDPAGQYASPYVGMGNNWPNGIDPTGKTSFWSAVENIGAFIALTPLGYMGASLESTDKAFRPVSEWNSNWWKGAITGDLIEASVIVGAEAGAASLWPSIGINTTSTLFGIEAGAAIGVAQSLAPTVITDAATHTWDYNELFADAVSGAISGAFQSNAMQHWIDGMNGTSKVGSGWLRIINHSWDVPDALQGVTSNVFGGILSSGVKGYLSYGANGGDWKGVDASVLGAGVASGIGQIFHQVTLEDDVYKGLSRYIQPIFSNLYSAYWQEFLTPGNLRDMGSGDFSSWGNNFLANWIGGWASDAFFPDGTHSDYYHPGIVDFGDPDGMCPPE